MYMSVVAHCKYGAYALVSSRLVHWCNDGSSRMKSSGVLYVIEHEV